MITKKYLDMDDTLNHFTDDILDATLYGSHEDAEKVIKNKDNEDLFYYKFTEIKHTYSSNV